MNMDDHFYHSRDLLTNNGQSGSLMNGFSGNFSKIKNSVEMEKMKRITVSDKLIEPSLVGGKSGDKQDLPLESPRQSEMMIKERTALDMFPGDLISSNERMDLRLQLRLIF